MLEMGIIARNFNHGGFGTVLGSMCCIGVAHVNTLGRDNGDIPFIHRWV